MIGHEHVSVESAAVLSHFFGQQRQVSKAITVGEKACAAIVAALYCVHGYVRKNQTGTARHGMDPGVQCTV
jgi:hypothetical protein